MVSRWLKEPGHAFMPSCFTSPVLPAQAAIPPALARTKGWPNPYVYSVFGLNPMLKLCLCRTIRVNEWRFWTTLPTCPSLSLSWPLKLLAHECCAARGAASVAPIITRVVIAVLLALNASWASFGSQPSLLAQAAAQQPSGHAAAQQPSGHAFWLKALACNSRAVPTPHISQPMQAASICPTRLLLALFKGMC
eukprot:1159047-Pelagomonas_calceolata.AAC.11